jgi:hypothetical protein
MQVEKNEMQVNYHEKSRYKMKEIKMTYLLTWALKKSRSLNVGLEERPIHW